MKRNLLTLIFIIFLIPSHAQPAYQAPKLRHADSWTLVLLPDPQTYMRFDRNAGIFNLMSSWIAENIDPLRIQMVLCTGDLVEQNDLLNPKPNEGNLTSRQQWQQISSSFGKLDHKVPYFLATGNHDYGFKSAENRSTHYDQYFPVDKNIANQRSLREIGPALNGQSSSVNALYEVQTTIDKSILVLVLEFAPRDTVLAWAKALLDEPKYVQHNVILLTHVFLDRHSTPIKKENYGIKDANYGEAVYEKLVKPAKNIRLVFSGHIGGPDDFNAHLGFRQDMNAAGKTVTQMTFNAQAMGGGWGGNGGDGWLRYLEFMADGKTVHVKTFSPLFAISPATQALSYKKEANQEFTFTMD